MKLLLIELLLIVNWKWNTLSWKLSIIELFIIVNWKWNNIQFEAIAPWAIVHCQLKVKQHSVWSYCSLSYCELKVKQQSVWSYCSSRYCPLWTESETTFGLKLLLLALLPIVNWKWNNIQFEAIAPCAIAHCGRTESEITFSLKLLLIELLLIVNWKWNNSQFEAIAPCAIAHCELKVKQHSVWSYCSLRYCPLWTESETTFSLKLLLLAYCSLWQNWKWNNIQFDAIAPWDFAYLWTESETTVSLKISLISELSLITWKGGESHRPSVADITPRAIARDLKRISFYRPKHYVLLTCKIPALSINTFSILYLYFFLLYLFKFCLLLKCSP